MLQMFVLMTIKIVKTVIVLESNNYYVDQMTWMVKHVFTFCFDLLKS